MENIEKQIVSAHNWVKTVQRDFMPRGHKPLGESSTVVDQIYVPFLNTTYVLVFESAWATIGGTRKDAVLYAYDHRTGNRRRVDSHTIFNGRDPMSWYYPTKIMAVISFVTKDRPCEAPYPEALRQIFRAGPFERKNRVQVRISMCEEKNARCEILGLYEMVHLEATSSGYCGRKWQEMPVSSQRWETGKINSSVLTKRNVCRFYKRYRAELPAVPDEIGAG